MTDNPQQITITYAGSPVDVTPLQKRKKSRVIPPDRRKKVAKACDMCKKRKQKCNGLQPCDLCSAKDQQCLYTAIDRRVLKPSKKRMQERQAMESPSTPKDMTPEDGAHEVKKSRKSSVNQQRSPSPNLAERQVNGYDSGTQIMQTKHTQVQQRQPQEQQYQWQDQLGGQPYQGHLPQIHHQPPLYNQPYGQFLRLPKGPEKRYIPPPQPMIPHHPVASPMPVRDVYNPPRLPSSGSLNLSQSSAPSPQSLPPPTSASTVTHKSINKSQTSSSPYSQTKVQIPASLQPLLSFPMKIRANEIHDESYNDYMISSGNDQNWRLLFDKAGNLRYLGDSSGTAYLLQCRKLFQKVLGPQKFSDDPERYTFVDAPVIALKPRHSDGLPDRAYTDYLVSTYLNNLNNVLYILDHDSLIQLVEVVYSEKDSSKIQQKDLCILYLVLAIASVYSRAEKEKKLFPFPPDYFTDPLVFFEIAMTILNSAAEDDNIWLAEAYLLIFFYYQFTGHKNTAWVKLGVAIRYGQGLGLNRKYVNESYKDPNFVLHRRKLFRSLFIMDTLSSIHLGRSMTLRLQDWDDIQFFDTIDDYSNKLLKVCELNSKILEHVYCNTNVTLKKALKIAVDLKNYTLKNPIKPVSPENYPAPVDHKSLLPHVIYLHGIILLSRPFFHFIMFKKLGLVQYDPASKNLPHLENFYHSCIKASLLIVKIVEYCYYQNIHPFKPLGLMSCTFHAGLVLGLLLLLRLKGIDHDMFKNDPQITVDPEAILSHAMASVIKVLVNYGRIDDQSKRYAAVLQSMLDVTNHSPETFDSNDSDLSSNDSQERMNTQQNFENILRFQDWLFPKPENLASLIQENMRSGFDPSPESNDNFLKDIASLNNMNATGSQFLDDFLYTVISRPSSAMRKTEIPNGGNHFYKS